MKYSAFCTGGSDVRDRLAVGVAHDIHHFFVRLGAARSLLRGPA